MRSSEIAATAPSFKPSAAFHSALSGLHVVELEAVHRVKPGLDGADFLGPLWRSLFGLALHTVSGTAFQSLMGDPSGPRTWALQPPLRSSAQGNDLAVWGVRLFGEAHAHADACLAAFEVFGTHGVGSGERRAQLEHATRRVIDLDAEFNAASAQTSGGLCIRFLTPLAVRRDSRVVDSEPTLLALLRCSLARLSRLTSTGLLDLVGQQEMQRLADCAVAASCQETSMLWVKSARRSRRRNETMALPGWAGTLRFAAPAGELRPFLTLGQALQLGSRTTFGLGMIDVR